MKKEAIMASVCVSLVAPAINYISSYDNPYTKQQYKPYDSKETVNDKYNSFSLSDVLPQNDEQLYLSFEQKETYTLLDPKNEKKQKTEIVYREWFDKYCSVLSHGTDSCDELIELLNNDRNDFYFYDFLMKFIVEAPLHLREIFIDNLLIGDIDIFDKTFKNILLQCSKLPSKTLAKKAYNMLELYSEGFDSL